MSIEESIEQKYLYLDALTSLTRNKRGTYTCVIDFCNDIILTVCMFFFSDGENVLVVLYFEVYRIFRYGEYKKDGWMVHSENQSWNHNLEIEST